MKWDVQGRDWPNRDSSRFVRAGGLLWHVQVMGSGPSLLLLHGTGAATHSWRDLAPRLARQFTVVAPDLPGHGFTQAPLPDFMSLPSQARLLGQLLERLGVTPAIGVGHSAGAAILARMALDERIAPDLLVSLNGALLPLQGHASHLFPAAAKLLSATRLVPRLFSLHATNRAWLSRFLDNTGSRIDAAGLRHYQELLRDPGHVASGLRMMAHWDLRPLAAALPDLACRVVLVCGEADRMIPPDDAARLARMLPDATLVSLPELGHLAHEERPDLVADLVMRLRPMLPAPPEAALQPAC
ncbi:alpha/beta fold hydrolase BchO [Lichenicoccus sp.]|uniref:alpha/beta fold hydrolase BchO n=1 Tax=Lichenicoccus sp. TaxID=2781899 RepID=UPI003D0F6E53